MKSYSARSLGEFGGKVAKGVKNAAKAVDRTGRRVVRDNLEITGGAKLVEKDARDIAEGVAKGLSKELSDVVSRKMKEKMDNQDKQ